MGAGNNWYYSDTPFMQHNGSTGESWINNPVNYDPALMRSIGFDGPSQVNTGGSGTSEQWDTNPALLQHLRDRGLRLAVSTGGLNTGKNYERAFDAQGNPVGSETSWDQNDDPGNVFLMGMLGAGAFGGAAALGAGAAGAAGGASAGQTAAEANAVAQINGSGAMVASSAGGLPEGVALGGAEGGGIGAGVGGVTPGLGSAGYVTPGLGAGGGGGGLLGGLTAEQLVGGVGAAASAAGGGGGSGGGGFGDYAGRALQFAGSPVGGAVIGALAGGAGAGSGLNSATTSQQNRLDPRLGNYVYGQNGNSGLLGNVNNVYSQQLAQGGLNDQQRQGMSNQLGVLNSPTYQSGFDSMRNAGQGLLNQPQAANPFMTGQAQLQQANPQIAALNQARLPYGGK